MPCEEPLCIQTCPAEGIHEELRLQEADMSLLQEEHPPTETRTVLQGFLQRQGIVQTKTTKVHFD